MNNLGIRTITGISQLIIGLAFLLFVPAGTLDYWQAWVYGSILGAFALLIFLYLYKYDPKLLERRLNRTEKESSQKWIQFYIFILYILELVLPSLDHRWGWSHVPWGLVVTGDILVVLGYLIMFLALKDNTFAATTITLDREHKVISTGAYAIIRHPMYIGAIVYLLGTPLGLGSWWGLILFIPITTTIVWRLLDEERFLSQGLAGYKEYCQKIRYRLIPLIW